jgi:hypothetical protein
MARKRRDKTPYKPGYRERFEKASKENFWEAKRKRLGLDKFKYERPTGLGSRVILLDPQGEGGGISPLEYQVFKSDFTSGEMKKQTGSSDDDTSSIKKKKATRGALTLHQVRVLENRYLSTIDKGGDVSAVADWQLRSRWPYRESAIMDEILTAKAPLPLSKKDRRALYYLDNEGIPSNQIAIKTNTKAATVRKRLSRLRDKLKKRQMAGGV